MEKDTFNKLVLQQFIEEHFDEIKRYYDLIFVSAASLVSYNENTLQTFITGEYIESEDPYYNIYCFSKKLGKFICLESPDYKHGYETKQEMLEHLDDVYKQICDWEKQAKNIEARIKD